MFVAVLGVLWQLASSKAAHPGRVDVVLEAPHPAASEAQPVLGTDGAAVPKRQQRQEALLEDKWPQ